MLSFMGPILPKYFASEWSFAQFRIVDSHAICAIKDNKIIGISNDGNYYLADIDPKNGGECKKIMQRNLLTEEESWRKKSDWYDGGNDDNILIIIATNSIYYFH